MYKEEYGGREENDARAQSSEGGREMNILVFWDFLRHFAWTSTWLSFEDTGYSASLASVGSCSSADRLLGF
jgi:hypothetical protein